MIRLAVLAAILACVLAACTPEAPTTTETAAAPPAPAQAPEPVAAEPTGCDDVRVLADELLKGKAAGMTEAQALDVLRERQAFTLSYVVDGVFHPAAPAPDAVLKADILAACRRMAETGSTY